MLSYRNLAESDCEFILQNWVGHSVIFRGNMSHDELLAKLKEMATKQYNGNYHEWFVLLNDGIPVGTFNLYQPNPNENAVYFGIEIDKDNRRKGFGTKAVQMAFEIAKEKGYEKITSQATVSNIPSVKLHAKCGFQIVERVINSKGNESYNYVYKLS